MSLFSQSRRIFVSPILLVASAALLPTPCFAGSRFVQRQMHLGVSAAHGGPAAQDSPAPAQGTTAGENFQAATLVLGDSIGALGAIVDQLHQTVVSLNVNKWKAPSDIRSATQADVDSIQRDLNNVLPDIMNRAKASPNALSPAFAVYRNIDAVYDVLLRVTETATLASAGNDASKLESARVALENGRSQLGSAILQATTDQDAALAQLRSTAPTTTGTAPSTPPSKTVVSDGPASTAKAKTARRKKSAAASGQSSHPQ